MVDVSLVDELVHFYGTGSLYPSREQWDSIGIVRYPSIKAFIDVFRDPDYRLAHHHRAAGTLHHKMVLLLDIPF
jgi:hypothetical protein